MNGLQRELSQRGSLPVQELGAVFDEVLGDIGEILELVGHGDLDWKVERLATYVPT